MNIERFSTLLLVPALALLTNCSASVEDDSALEEAEQLSSALTAATPVNGLTVIVNFTDLKLSATPSEIAAMMNQPSGYSNWGNNGSVNQYFTTQTNGHLALSNQVVTVSINHPYSYYAEATTFDGGQVLTSDTVAALNQAFPAGFSGLSKAPGENRLWSFVLMYAAPSSGGVSFPLGDTTLALKNDGVSLPVRTVVHVPYATFETPKVGVVCHELGHHLFGWTDYYVASGTSSNIGHYCNMGSGGDVSGAMPINPGLRYQQHWIDNVTDLVNANGATYTVTANDRSRVFKYTNPQNPQEYYLIEALAHGGYYVTVDGNGYTTDEGLAIWYVDEGYAPMGQFPRIRLVQADGHDDMNDPSQSHHTLRGDLADLFDSSNTFSATSYPDFAWKDGSKAPLVIRNISAPGATMSFVADAQQGSTCVSNALARSGASASSVENATFPASNAVDGNLSTRWSSVFSDNQTLTVDLGASRYIDRLSLVWEAASAADYRVELSSDGVTWTVAKTFTGGSGARTDNLTSLSAHVGRYVRMVGTRRSTQWGYSLYELQVFGDTNPACSSAAPCTETALTRVAASASSTEASWTPSQAIDAQIQPTRWGSAFAGLSASAADAQSLTVDLGAARYVSRLALNWEAASAAAYAIDLSSDGNNWTQAKAFSGGAAGPRTDTLTNLSAHTARYVRMRGIQRATQWGYSLYDLSVLGDANAACSP
jgi:M6 family metalloprotease-like protein